MVEQGDRIGIYFDVDPGAIAYVFDVLNPTSLQYRVENTSFPTQIGENIQFDALIFPYDFSVVAYIDTGIYMFVLR